MDKEILRIVIIATGMLVVIGMLVWAYIKDKKAREDMDFYDDAGDHPLTSDASDIKGDFDIASLAASESHAGVHPHEYYDEDDDEDYYEQDDDIEPPPRATAPAIIQFSIITKADEDFNGADLVEAFEAVGLEYGSLKIFERLDANRLVDYGVACIVEPGTFPDKDLENFYCPGIVFFMQPEALDDAPAVFDDYVETINTLAAKLDGVILDHRRQPLTEATVQAIRQSL
ncbi:MAG: cell division protein ZipA C-terminal FtsZ-binding domain-containing protein [Methylobacter sp.]|jgi:cell division protein ZipA|uniref:cell division protein ZipA C-terminal FtsZ-binding domain-containing protein n=1 Tax=Methylobacter sp. TaxID=2051955 RepID=UPI0025D5FFED|nr:cell division protein ZipA C-terminal FtsZ-binding domain-containing protein [Methylobacter sp.]MCK9622969.1 cell division protein ZipA C-terminal FtsZ-binding domain-containing protein [Methylobacter sp.]